MHAHTKELSLARQRRCRYASPPCRWVPANINRGATVDIRLTSTATLECGDGGRLVSTTLECTMPEHAIGERQRASIAISLATMQKQCCSDHAIRLTNVFSHNHTPYYSLRWAKVVHSRLAILLFSEADRMARSWFWLFRAKNSFLSSSSWI
jgi:hypothetical protein